MKCWRQYFFPSCYIASHNVRNLFSLYSVIISTLGPLIVALRFDEWIAEHSFYETFQILGFRWNTRSTTEVNNLNYKTEYIWPLFIGHTLWEDGGSENPERFSTSISNYLTDYLRDNLGRAVSWSCNFIPLWRELGVSWRLEKKYLMEKEKL